MTTLLPIIAEAHARLLATPPVLTANLSVTVGQVVAQRADKNPDGKLCREGVVTAMRKLKLRQPDTDTVISLPAALDAGLELTDVLRVIDACHPDGEKILRLFAADCAEMVLPLFERDCPEDKRARQAIEAARGYVLGAVTAEKLNAAWAAAGNAARAAARDAAWAAAWDAARAAAGNAARAAARDAAWAAARDAAWDAAWAAAWAACVQLLSRYHITQETPQ